MSSTRASTAGATRTCPHCRAMILDSSAVCPQCQKYLRFDSTTDVVEEDAVAALEIEGTLTHSPSVGDQEYTMLLTIRDEKGEELSRQVIGVGAVGANQSRTFALSVRVSGKPGRTS